MGLLSCFTGSQPPPKPTALDKKQPGSSNLASQTKPQKGTDSGSQRGQRQEQATPATGVGVDPAKSQVDGGPANEATVQQAKQATTVVAHGIERAAAPSEITPISEDKEANGVPEAAPAPPDDASPLTPPTPIAQPLFPSTFDVLTRNVPFPSGRPEALQGLRPSCRALQVCSTPPEMLWDVDHLTYINRGSTSVVFHGVWQGAEVAVKFLMANFNEHSASVREALLGAELSHPNVVRCFTARCCTLSEAFMESQHLDTIPPLAAQRALINTTAAQLPKSLFRNSFDSEDGFGPPPCTLMLLLLARASTASTASVASTTPAPSEVNSTTGNTETTPSPVPTMHDAGAAAASFQPPGEQPGQPSGNTPAKQLDAAAAAAAKGYNQPRPRTSTPTRRSPWAGELNWANVLKTLNATAGKVLTMIICEYCDMGTLSTAIHEKRVFDMTGMSETSCVALRALIRTACDATLGLHHLHQAGIIHGDIKPGNLLLIGARNDRRGFRAKLTDLGTARVTPLSTKALGGSCPNVIKKATGPNDVLLKAAGGTIPYMAPEHFAGVLVEASDIYSLGVVMWELCHGAVPFRECSEAEITQGVVTGRLQLTWSASVPHALAELVCRCMQHAPAKRPSTAELLSKLAAIEAQIRDDMQYARGGVPDDTPVPQVPVPAPPAAQTQPVQPVIPQPVPPSPPEAVKQLVKPGPDEVAVPFVGEDGPVPLPAGPEGGGDSKRPNVQALQAQLLQLAIQTAAAARADKLAADQNPAMAIAPPPVAHWPQLPPLLRAPKHVTLQGTEKTPEEIAHAEAQKAVDTVAGKADMQAVLKAPYSVANLGNDAVHMLLQRGAELAMQQAREEHRTMKAQAAGPQPAAPADLQPATPAAPTTQQLEIQPAPPASMPFPQLARAQPPSAVAAQPGSSVQAMSVSLAGGNAPSAAQGTVFPAGAPGTTLPGDGEDMEIVVEGIEVKWVKKQRIHAPGPG